MTPELRNELLAKAMVGRYRLGFLELSLLLAGTLFETIIDRNLKKYDQFEPWSDKRIVDTLLNDKIYRLCKLRNALTVDSLFVPQLRHVFKLYRPINDKDRVLLMCTDGNLRLRHVARRLNNFKWLRNKTMHGSLATVKSMEDNLIDDMITYIWRELAPRSFDCYLKKWEEDGCRGRIVDTILKHDADYMIRGIDEVDIQTIDNSAASASSDWSINLFDLGNMFKARDKLVALKKYLPSWLEANASHLHTNTLTTIDTTSAYVWMPLTRIDSETQQGIISCSVSILVTPLDIRIYMDFGGMAVDYRRQYYDFLNDDSYRDFALDFEVAGVRETA